MKFLKRLFRKERKDIDCSHLMEIKPVRGMDTSLPFSSEPATLYEADLVQTSGLDATINWRNSNPEIIKKENGLNPLIQDEIGQFDPTRAERWKMGPIQTAPDWTEFKARNPELFHPKKTGDCIITGEVLNGTLFTEGPDGSVLQYTLRNNIPPNGRYTIHGTADSRNIIHVTKYKTHEKS